MDLPPKSGWCAVVDGKYQEYYCRKGWRELDKGTYLTDSDIISFIYCYMYGILHMCRLD